MKLYQLILALVLGALAFYLLSQITAEQYVCVGDFENPCEYKVRHP